MRVHWHSGEVFDGKIIDSGVELLGANEVFRFRVRYDADDDHEEAMMWHTLDEGAGGDVSLVEQRPPQAIGDVMASDWQTLQLTCAISLARLTDPAKGVACAHSSCCNFEALKGAVARMSSKKQCPVIGCGVRLSRSHDIVRDETLAGKLRAVPDTVSKVRVRGDKLEWNDQETSTKRPRTEIDLDDLADASEVAMGATRVKTELAS